MALGPSCQWSENQMHNTLWCHIPEPTKLLASFCSTQNLKGIIEQRKWLLSTSNKDNTIHDPWYLLSATTTTNWATSTNEWQTHHKWNDDNKTDTSMTACSMLFFLASATFWGGNNYISTLRFILTFSTVFLRWILTFLTLPIVIRTYQSYQTNTIHVRKRWNSSTSTN